MRLSWMFTPGDHSGREKILFHCDNIGVVEIWESGSTCASETMALVCLLYFAVARYINDRFKQLALLANPTPEVIPAWLIQSFIEASCSAANLSIRSKCFH